MLGFTAWSIRVLRYLDVVALNPAVQVNLDRCVTMGKVVAAVGMIMLALEDELAINKIAGERERRLRQEMEAYTGLVISRRRLEDFDRQGNEICRTVVEKSRFAQVALLLNTGGQYRLAGAAGLDGATIAALNALARRIPVEGFLVAGMETPAVENSLTVNLDLGPWLKPGDDLKRLRFTSVRAVPLVGRAATEGALLLTGMRNAREPLKADDLLPVEMLASRLQAVRSQTMMLEKLIDAEKFAGLGQLANNVTLQLNNPLTVILGYASLLDEAPALTPQERKGVDVDPGRVAEDEDHAGEPVADFANPQRTQDVGLRGGAAEGYGGAASIGVLTPFDRLQDEHYAGSAQGAVRRAAFAPGGAALPSVRH